MWTQFIGLFLLAAIIFLLCQLNSTIKFYVKFAVYYIVMSVSAIVVLLLATATPGDPNNFRYMTFPFAVCRYLLRIHPEVRGKKNLKSDGPFILISNHQSSLDFLGAGTIIPPRCTFLAKKELFYAGPFGLACWLCGMIFIDRRSHNSAVSTMIDTAKTIVKRNYVVWIFPEGRRNSGKGMLPFKTGAFHLAVQAQVPLVPVVYSAYDFYDKKRKRLDAGRYIITALPPVPTIGLTSDDVPALTDRVRQQMMKVYAETSS